MFYNKTTSRYVLIGIAFANSYACTSDNVPPNKGEDNGVWNKVSAHMEWIKHTMEGLGEKICKADSG